MRSLREYDLTFAPEIRSASSHDLIIDMPSGRPDPTGKTPLLPPWAPRDLARRLDALRFGFETALELACSWLISTPELDAKLQLGRVVWHVAMAVDAIRDRLAELRANAPAATPSNVRYAQACQALQRVTDGAARLATLHDGLLADLSHAVREAMALGRSIADAPTAWALAPVVPRLDDLLAAWKAGAGPVLSRDPASDAALSELSASGGSGVCGDAIASVGGRRPTIDDTPARSADLVVFDPVGPPPDGPLMFLHSTLFNIEICAAEVCASMILDPAAPWPLRRDLSRQVWDEVRHAEALARRIAELGGRIGGSPIDLRVWRACRAGESLAEKLMIQQRIGEGGGLDGGFLVQCGRQQGGDLRTAALFQYINLDEVNHVALGNAWLRELVGDDDPAIAELEARARRTIARVGCERAVLPPWIEGRRLAGFTEPEIAASRHAYEQQRAGRAPAPGSSPGGESLGG